MTSFLCRQSRAFAAAAAEQKKESQRERDCPSRRKSLASHYFHSGLVQRRESNGQITGRPSSPQRAKQNKYAQCLVSRERHWACASRYLPEERAPLAWVRGVQLPHAVRTGLGRTGTAASPPTRPGQCIACMYPTSSALQQGEE